MMKWHILLTVTLALAACAHEAPIHAHETLMIAEEDPVPLLTLDANKDPVDGWNLHIITERFTWAPEHASTAHVLGEGHAHVYVDGVKIGRAYGPWYYLKAPAGATVMVELSTNDHKTYATSSGEIVASAVLG